MLGSMKRSLLIAPVAALVLLGAGCGGSSAPTTTGTGAAAPAAQTGSNLLGRTSACAHPYYPLRDGYSITYANRFQGGTSGYTMSVSDVTANQAKLTVEYQGGTRSEQTYVCNNGAIQASGYVDFAAGMTGASASAQTRSVEGELLPRDLRVGSSWNTRFVISMNMGGVPGMGGDLNGTVSIRRTAEAQERVTVPAGTFQAIRVKSETDFRFDPVAGAAPEAFPPLVSYEWWVEGKGLVKTTMGGDQSIVSEATAINTP
jgi:hypothetical protein